MSDDSTNPRSLPSADGTDSRPDPVEARDPDEVLSPAPFRDPEDFAPIPPPKASLADLVELAGHIAFVLSITVLVPLAIVWAIYRLYRWLPLETIAFVIVALASLWAYRDRLGPVLRRLLFGREKK